MRTGVEGLIAGEAADLRAARIGLIAHPASVTSELTPSVSALIAAGFDVRALFGPQHGARGEKQDNMVESADYVDAATGLPVHSLYGPTRRPTPAMLEGLDAVLFDLQDVGVRVYTFVWTMALAMEACAEAGVRFVVLDRPNPIGLTCMEGPVLRPGFESFVGLHPVPLRHGLTCRRAGSLAERRARNRLRPRGGALRGPRARHDVGATPASRGSCPARTFRPPTPCDVYPGMVLLEGTNLSEGRGTTRPFELFGAPFIDPHALAARLADAIGRGVRLRPCFFEPTFQKHAGTVCGGAQLHVTDREAFRPVRAAVSVLRAVRDLAGDALRWREPPYEYETEKMPIDILWGHDGLRTGIDEGAPVERILAGIDEEIAAFRREASPYLLYA